MATAHEKILIEVSTAANMLGAAEARASFLALSPSTFALGAVLAVVIIAGKSAFDIAQAQTQAHSDLDNAIADTKGNAQDINASVGAFLEAHPRLYSSQSDVIEGFAAFVREGVPANRLTEDMTTAMDISAAEDISLTDAVGLLQSAEAGRTVGLKKMVGQTLETTKASDTLAQKEAIAQANIDIVSARYKGSADAMSDLAKNTDEMGNHWQDFADGPGQQLVRALTFTVHEANELIDTLSSQSFWDGLDRFIIDMGKAIETNYILPLRTALDAAQGAAGLTGDVLHPTRNSSPVPIRNPAREGP